MSDWIFLHWISSFGQKASSLVTPGITLHAGSLFLPQFTEYKSGLSREFVFVRGLNMDLCLVIRCIVLVFWCSLEEATLRREQGWWRVKTKWSRDNEVIMISSSETPEEMLFRRQILRLDSPVLMLQYLHHGITVWTCEQRVDALFVMPDSTSSLEFRHYTLQHICSVTLSFIVVIWLNLRYSWTSSL